MSWFQRLFRFNQYNRDLWIREQASKLQAGSLVLDVGAGAGPYRPLFEHCEYHAHDFAKEPGTQGKYTKLDFVSDILNIPVSDESYDMVLCTEVLEHVPEPVKALFEFSRILKPHGKLIVTAPLGAHLHQQPYHFYGGFTPFWYEKFLKEAGFVVDSISANKGFFSFYSQESLRFHALLASPGLLRGGIHRRCLHLLVWMMTLPYCRILLPSCSGLLDQSQLENIATVGYHVVATKRFTSSL